MSERIKIVCPLCKREFFQDEFGTDNAASACECGNINMGIKEFKSKKQKLWVTCNFNEEYPTVEIIQEEQDED